MELNRKVFETFDKDGKEIKLAIVRPTQEITNKADLKYVAAVSNAIREGAMTKAECELLIKERGIWGEKQEKKIEKIRKEMRTNEKILLAKGLSKSKGGKAAKEIQRLRSEMLVIMMDKNAYMDLCAEAYGDKIRNQVYIACCTVYADSGEPFYEDVNDYLARSEEIASIQALANLTYFLNDIDEDYASKFIENQYMRENKLMDKEGYYLDKKGRRIDSNGRLINDRLQYVNEKGELLDEFGYRVGEDGQLLPDEEEKEAE